MTDICEVLGDHGVKHTEHMYVSTEVVFLALKNVLGLLKETQVGDRAEKNGHLKNHRRTAQREELNNKSTINTPPEDVR